MKVAAPLPAPEIVASSLPRDTPAEKVPLAVDARATEATERKTHAALAKLSSELAKAESTMDAHVAIRRTQHALTGVEVSAVHATLQAFSDGAMLLGHDDCPDFAQVARDAGKGVKDWRLMNAYGELAGAARSLVALHGKERQARTEAAAHDALKDGTDFALGVIDGANPLPSPGHGSAFHHERAYQAGHLLGVLLGFAGDMTAMLGGGGMIAASGAMALASGGALAPAGAVSAAAGASLIGAGAAGMAEHTQKLKEHAEPIVIHEARTLEQYRANGKKPPKDVTLPSGKPDPSAVASGPRHEVNAKWDAVKKSSVRGEQRVHGRRGKRRVSGAMAARDAVAQESPG